MANPPAVLTAALAKAERPAILIGSRNASAAVLKAAQGLAFEREGWNGFNVLPVAASLGGAMTTGWAGEGLAALAARPPEVLFLLGVDEIDLAPFAGATIIYIGSHGDRGAAAADIILPGGAWAEKPGTYVNMEGRVQRSLRATFPPGDAREDWTIWRALAASLGVTLPYDTLDQLRQRIAAEWPALGREGILPATQAGRYDAASPTGPARRRQRNFYMSNPVLRASPTMQDCVTEIIEGRKPSFAEAAE